MKAHSKIGFYCSIMFFIILGCTPKENNKVTITINSTTQHDADVIISHFRNLNQTKLIESKTDSVGFCSFEVPLDKPMFAVIQIGKKYGEVYLTSGSTLTINENGAAYTIPLTFSGQGAEINNYIALVNSTTEKIKWAHGKGLGEIEVDEFLHRFDSLKTTINNFHEHYIDSFTLAPEVISMLEYKNNIKFLEAGQEFKFYKLNNTVNEKWEAHRNGKTYLEGNVSKELEKLTSEIPFDTTLLTDGHGDYQTLLNFYWHNKINLPVSEQVISSKDPENLSVLMTNDLINKGDYPAAIREFLVGFNINYWILGLGITPETDSVFARFKRTYPHSKYLPAISEGYNEWLALAPGKPAPEFEGYTPEGKKVSILDLKGKIVYMDVWATWCAPCIAEIPASKKLQQELIHEDKIQFLNVSVDSRRTDWESFLKKDTSWKGLHIIIDPEKIQSLYTTYKLFGIPDYILIDPSGNIVSMKASRPSDEEKIREEIKQLLARSL